MKAKVTLSLEPQEFRSLLSPNLQELFDSMVKTFIETASSDQKEAETIVAQLLLTSLKKVQSEAA